MKRAISLFIATAAFSAAANAADLVTNGGFESGDFTGWTVGATSGSFAVTTFAHTGKYGAALESSNNTGASVFMEQVVPETSLSDISSFDVWIATSGATVTMNILDGKGGLFEYDKTFSDTGRGWVDWNLLSTISGGSLTQISQIEFEIDGVNGGQNGVVHFDDVSLQTLSTPEPASYLVLAPGILFFARKRRRA